VTAAIAGLGLCRRPLRCELVRRQSWQDKGPTRNGALGAVTGFPSIVALGGFSSPTPTAAIGVPVGIELKIIQIHIIRATRG